MKLSHSQRWPALLSFAVLCCYGAVMVGCNGDSGSTTTTATSSDTHAAHDDDHHDEDGHDDHDHGDSHAGHDHPAHGPNGGHMMELSGGAHAEWAHDDLKDQITVYPENADKVSKVVMQVTAADGKVTPYEFEKSEADGKTFYQIVSPELLTAVKMGEPVETKLVISTDDGEVTGAVEHHSH